MVLLTDLYAVWPEDQTFMPTQELVRLLVAHNPEYWGSGSTYGKRFNESRLGRLLNQATNKTSERPDSHGPRGYTRAMVQLAWNRLGIVFPPPPNNPENLENSENPEQQTSGNAFMGQNSYHPADCSGLSESAECSGLPERGTRYNTNPAEDDGQEPENTSSKHPESGARPLSLRERLLGHANGQGTTAPPPGDDRPKTERVLEFVNSRDKTTSKDVLDA